MAEGGAAIARATWPHAELVGALEALVAAARLRGAGARAVSAGAVPASGPRLEEFLVDRGRELGVDVDEVELDAASVGDALPRVAPALVAAPGSEAGWLLLTRASGRRAELLAPSGERVTLARRALEDALCAELRTGATREVARVLDAARLGERARLRAEAALVRARLEQRSVTGIHVVRAPAAQWWRGTPGRDDAHARVVGVLGAQLAASMLWVLMWWLVGRAALGGMGEPGWIAAWAIALGCVAIARTIVVQLQGTLAIELGVRLRRRILEGALAHDPQRTRGDGIGRLLGLVLESSALESQGLSGGAQVALAAVELIPAPFVLALGAGGGWHAMLLVAWLVPVALAVRWQVRRRSAWTDERLALTHDLVEKIAGHPTRLAQQTRERLHDEEDPRLRDYDAASRALDRSKLGLLHLLARGWLVVAMAALAPAFVDASASPERLAASVGGVLLAYAALERLAGGASQLVAAIVAWRRVAPLVLPDHAGDATATSGVVSALDRARPREGAPIVEARDVRYRFPSRAQPALDGVSLSIRIGDRVLLEGASGSGKSTLASLLAAQRAPEVGGLTLDRLDLATVGRAKWRRRVALVPQFHDNHVFADTFLFNVLMSRGWPPTAEDFQAALEVCTALGLDQVLDRMPAGLGQMVGDTGWKLSHGERSRLFIARALLQDAEVVILDESLAALDPALLEKVGAAVLERARTLVVIAHP